MRRDGNATIGGRASARSWWNGSSLLQLAGCGDQLETDEERKKRLAQLAQSRQMLTQNSSPAATSLFGGVNGTGVLR